MAYDPTAQDDFSDPASSLYGTRGLAMAADGLSVLDALGPVGTGLRLIMEQAAPVRSAQVHRFLENLSDLCGDALPSGKPSPQATQLLQRALDAAARTALAEKLPLLAKVAAEGLTNAAKVDEAQFKLRTLAEIEPLHVTAMHVVQKHHAVTVEVAGKVGVERPTNKDVHEAISAVGAVGQAVIADCVRLGLVAVPEMGYGPQLTPYGTAMLAFLEDQGSSGGLPTAHG